MYQLRPRRTTPQALLFMCFLLMMVILSLNVTLLTLSPQYMTFGNQRYPSLPALPSSVAAAAVKHALNCCSCPTPRWWLPRTRAPTHRCARLRHHSTCSTSCAPQTPCSSRSVCPLAIHAYSSPDRCCSHHAGRLLQRHPAQRMRAAQPGCLERDDESGARTGRRGQRRVHHINPCRT